MPELVLASIIGHLNLKAYRRVSTQSQIVVMEHDEELTVVLWTTGFGVSISVLFPLKNAKEAKNEGLLHFISRLNSQSEAAKFSLLSTQLVASTNYPDCYEAVAFESYFNAFINDVQSSLGLDEESVIYLA